MAGELGAHDYTTDTLPAVGAPTALEVSNQVTVDASTDFVGVAVYVPANETGTYTVYCWSGSSGDTVLGTGTLVDPSSGWNFVAFTGGDVTHATSGAINRYGYHCTSDIDSAQDPSALTSTLSLNGVNITGGSCLLDFTGTARNQSPTGGGFEDDDFGCSPYYVDAGTDVSPAVIAAAAAVPAPTIGAGAGITATAVAAVAALPAPTVGAGAGVTVVTVAAVAALPAATLDAGAASTFEHVVVQPGGGSAVVNITATLTAP